MGLYEIYSVPQDQSRLIILSSPVNHNCLLAFHWNSFKSNWVQLNFNDLKEPPISKKLEEVLFDEFSRIVEGYLNVSL